MPRPRVPLDPERLNQVTIHMAGGMSLVKACRQPGAPSWHVVNEWRKRYPGVDWFLRVSATRELPGASAVMAEFVAKEREQVRLTGRSTPWTEIEAKMRMAEEVRMAAPVQATPYDPADPSTFF